MTRWIPAAAIAAFVLGAQAAYAQAPAREASSSAQHVPGRQHRRPGARRQQGPVSARWSRWSGRTTAAATTDRDGRYTLRELPYGPYILSVHSRGYFKSRGRTIQLTRCKSLRSRNPAPDAEHAEDAGGQGRPRCRCVPAVQTTQLAGFGLDEAAPALPTPARLPSTMPMKSTRAKLAKPRGVCATFRAAF